MLFIVCLQDTYSLLPQPDLAASLALLTGASGKKGGTSSFAGLSFSSSHGKMSTSASQAAAAAAAYEAVLADMNKMADLSAKVNSYSHEAKVSGALTLRLALTRLGKDQLRNRRAQFWL
jgi:hypothetical protein